MKRINEIPEERLRKMMFNVAEFEIEKINERTIIRLYDEATIEDKIITAHFVCVDKQFKFDYITEEEYNFLRSDIQDDQDYKKLLEYYNQSFIEVYKSIASLKGFRKVKQITIKSRFFETNNIVAEETMVL